MSDNPFDHSDANPFDHTAVPELKRGPVGDFLSSAQAGLSSGLKRGAAGLLMAPVGAAHLLGVDSEDRDTKIFDMAQQLRDSAAAEPPPPDTFAGKAGGFVGGLGAGIATLGAGEAGATGQDVIQAGGTVGQAQAGAGLAGAASVAALGLGGIGSTIPQRVLGQGLAGGALGELSRRAENSVLPDSMQRPFDPVELGLNVGAAGAAGFLPHARPVEGPPGLTPTLTRRAQGLEQGVDAFNNRLALPNPGEVPDFDFAAKPGGPAMTPEDLAAQRRGGPGFENPTEPPPPPPAPAPAGSLQASANLVEADKHLAPEVDANGRPAPAGTLAEAAETETGKSTSSGVGTASVDPDSAHKALFESRVNAIAGRQGLQPDLATELLGHLHQPLPRDRVTGFYRAEELDPAAERAQQWTRESGKPAVYVEGDLKNLNGLNAKLGTSGADTHIKAVAKIMQEQLGKLGDVVPVRKGGDEYGFIVTGADVQSVHEAARVAQSEVESYARQNELTDIAHTKKNRDPGFGIHFGAAEIDPNRPLKETFQAADRQVEARKLGKIDYEFRKPIAETGADGKSAGSGGRATEAAGKGPAVAESGSGSDAGKPADAGTAQTNANGPDAGSAPSGGAKPASPTALNNAYKKVEDKASPAAVNAVNDAVSKVRANWKNAPDIVVHPTADTLHPDITSAPGFDHTVEAAYHDGKIHVIASHIKDLSRVPKVLAHEAIGHYGMDAVFKDKWPQIIESVKQLRNKPPPHLKDIFDHIDKAYNNPDDRTFAREAIAIMSERGIKNSLMDRALTTVRQFIRETLGMNTKFSEAELRQMLVKAQEHVEGGGAKPQPFDINFSKRDDDESKPAGTAAAQSVSEPSGVRGGAGLLELPSRQAARDGRREPDGSLKGLPRGGVNYRPRLSIEAERVAAQYMANAGLKYDPPNTFAKVDKARATRIAQAYDEMKHDPQNPAVQRAYKAMIDETLAQYQEIKKSGLKVDFIDPKQGDPYKGNPRNMTEDVRKNNHMWVFSTKDGFGSDATFDASQNPLLGATNETISGKPALANDIFRVVHDYFGHVKEGVGFRHDGEENAWRSHSSMYSPEARAAMTSETRGQNSWVNFGPHGEANRTATSEGTHYADQKIGLLPKWAIEEGAHDAREVRGNQTESAAAKPEDASQGGKDGSGENLQRDAQEKRTGADEKLSQVDFSKSPKEILGKYARYLASNEFEKQRVDTAEKMVDTLQRLPSVAEMANTALAGQAKRGWYAQAGRVLTRTFGLDAPRFTSLLAATSPRIPVEGNLENALKIWKTWVEDGRPNDVTTIKNIMTQALGGDPRSVLNAWVPNTVRALTSESPEHITLSGPKVHSFMQNLMGQTNAVINDAWMAAFHSVDQLLFKGEFVKPGDPGFRPGYLSASVRTRQAAEYLSKLTGEAWTPAEVQETVWSWSKIAHELSEKTGKPITELVGMGDINDDLIRATPAFGDLLHDEKYRGLLPSDKTSAGGNEAVGSKESGTGSQATATAPDIGRLLKTATRLDNARNAPDFSKSAPDFTHGEVADEPRRGFLDRLGLVNPNRAAEAQHALESLRMRDIGRGIFRSALAWKDRNITQADQMLKASQKMYDARPAEVRADPAQNFDGVIKYQQGRFNEVTDPGERAFLNGMASLLQDQAEKIRQFGTDKLNLLSDYFPQMWADEKGFASWNAKRPLGGDRGFTKARVFDDIADGLQAGYKPKFENPADMVMARYISGEKYLSMLQMKFELEQQGFLRQEDRTSPGYARVNDNAFNGYVVPEDVAKDLNNYLAPGLNQFQAWRGFRKFQNTLLASRLGFSAFHAGFTTVDATIMHLDLAARYLMDGNLKGAVENLGHFGTAPLRGLAEFFGKGKGSQFVRDFTGSAEVADPHMKAVYDALTEGGARAFMDPTDFNNSGAQFMRDMRKGDYLKGTVLHGLPAALEATTKIIATKLVPAQKMMARVSLMKYELDHFAAQHGKQTGDYAGIVEAMDPANLRQIANSVVQRVDDRLGQVAYDNLFWNRTVKDLAQASIQSVGWNFGTFNTIFGGLKDVGKVFKPEQLLNPVNGQNAAMSRISGRLSYLVALNVGIGLLGAFTQKMLTGQSPEELRDYFFPKTGNKNVDGSDARISFPSYIKDEYAFSQHPLITVQHKLHPAFGMVSELLNNKDYYGNMVYNPDDPWTQVAGQIAGHLVGGFKPYAVQNMQQQAKTGAGLAGLAAPFVGVTPAPGDITHSKFQTFVQDRYYASHPSEGKTPEKAEDTKAFVDAAARLRNGETPDLSQFNAKERASLLKYVKADPIGKHFDRLELQQKLIAYQHATAEERDQYKLRNRILNGKWSEAIAKEHSEDAKQNLRKQVLDLQQSK